MSKARAGFVFIGAWVFINELCIRLTVEFVTFEFAIYTCSLPTTCGLLPI